MMNKTLFAVLFLGLFAIGANGVKSYLALAATNAKIFEEIALAVNTPGNPAYGQYLTAAQVNKFVAPAPSSLEKVYSWLHQEGASDIQVYGDAMVVETVLPLPTIPTGLKDLVLFVESKLAAEAPSARIRPDLRKMAKGSTNATSVPPAATGFVAREVLYTLYNISYDLAPASYESVGAIEFMGESGFSQTALNRSQWANDIPTNLVDTSHQIGPDTLPDGETELDIQMLSQMGTGAEIWFWDSPLWVYSFLVDFINAPVRPNIISISWGWAEEYQCTIVECGNLSSAEYIALANFQFAKLAAMGVSVMVASGDAGAPGRTDEGCLYPPRAVFPGSSPWVTSVGATYIVAEPGSESDSWKTPLCQDWGCANGTTEHNTYISATSWTSGGGISRYTPRPTWQIEAMQGYLDSGVAMPTGVNTTGRAYPDVAVVGHNCPVFDPGFLESSSAGSTTYENPFPEDGTSCSSPVFAGIVALLNQYQVARGHARMGFLNPTLYAMATEHTTAFHDYSDGGNYASEMQTCPTYRGYYAAQGYDPVYGLGTPNVGEMITWLNTNL